MNLKKSLTAKFIGISSLLLLTATIAQGMILLTIDVSDPSAVVITATGGLSDTTATSDAANFPIQLKNFFTSNPGTTTYSDSSSSLQGPSAGVNLDSILGGRSGPSQTTAILRQGSGTAETFTAGEVGFTGSATFDLSFISELLPSLGHSGNITTDNAGLEIVGTYSVAAVPEPGTFGLFGAIVTFGVIGLRRRRRA